MSKPKDDLLIKAIKNLNIDVPVMASRVVGDRIELYLYGGCLVTYPEDAPASTPKTETKPKTKFPAVSQSKKKPRNSDPKDHR